MDGNRSIFHWVSEIAVEAGFAAGGIAAVPEPGSAADYEELRNFEPWIDQGRAGEMDYLKRRDEAGRMLRSSLRIAVPWARSVIVCAANYNAAAPRSIDAAPENSGWIARYAWSAQEDAAGTQRPSDYHKVLLRRLEEVEGRLRARFAKFGDAAGDFQSRCYVDTGPVIERVYARHAGIGWVGKNTCILNSELGSWLFLGVIVTSLEIDHGAGHATLPPDRCGSCTRCIDACPTNALTPYEMDASLCISYLTIEKRGEIAEPLRALMGRQVFGCDICQNVCPWNRKAPISADRQLMPREELINPALEWLASLDEAEFGRAFHGSPVTRTKLSGLRRNVAIAMGNSGLREFLPRLEEWAASEDAVLAEAASWASTRIGEATAGAVNSAIGEHSSGSIDAKSDANLLHSSEFG
jgi:epoxyqueuosine reductase